MIEPFFVHLRRMFIFHNCNVNKWIVFETFISVVKIKKKTLFKSCYMYIAHSSILHKLSILHVLYSMFKCNTSFWKCIYRLLVHYFLVYGMMWYDVGMKGKQKTQVSSSCWARDIQFRWPSHFLVTKNSSSFICYNFPHVISFEDVLAWIQVT